MRNIDRKIDLSALKAWNTVRETARMLDLSPRRVERLCQQGRFPGVDRAGTAYIIYAESIRRFLTAPKPKPGRPRRRLAGSVAAGVSRAD